VRRRLALGLTPLAVALALMLPASTLAASAYTYTINRNYCTDYPANVFKVTIAADGTTNANRMTIDSKGQSGEPGNWTTYQTWPRVGTTFAAYTYGVMSLKRTYLGDAFSHNRIVFTLRAWHNSTLKASMKLISRIC
jgi:hypothetical protein